MCRGKYKEQFGIYYIEIKKKKKKKTSSLGPVSFILFCFLWNSVFEIISPLRKILCTGKPLYTDIQYNDKVRYNDTKPLLNR